MSTLTVTSGALPTAPDDLDAITDEDYLRQLWQQAEDFGERRRIRSRMYKLREQRLREMVQNDEEALGTLATAPDVSERSETTITVGEDERGRSSTRRTSNIQVTMQVDGNTAVTESISAQNVRIGGLTMRGVDTVTLDGSSSKDTTGLSDEEIINEQVRAASQERGTRYRKIIGDLGDSADNDNDTRVSITKSTYSIQSNALAGEGYLSMKNKEVRDSVSPTRIIRERKSSAEEDSRLTSDDETVSKVITTKTESTVGEGRKVSREEKTTTKSTARNRVSEIPVRKDANSRRVTNKKPSKELDLNTTSGRRGTPERASPSSPSKRVPGEPGSRSTTTTTTLTTTRRGGPRETTTTTTTTRTTGRKTDASKPGSRIATAPSSTRKSKLAEVENRMEASIMAELDKLDTYLDSSVSPDDEVIQQEEEDAVDESGNVVRMVVETRRKKDGTVFTARRVARSTKVVENEDDIDEILIGNPDHEVLERHVAEEEDKDGSKIKIITETRKRPDGIEYTTKNILKTSKIFDYDHPEDVAYCEHDELVGTDEKEETDDAGVTIKTITETRRKPDGIEYTTKKVYKTSKVKTITPSSDDEIISTKESEETQSDGTIIRTIIETRRTKTGEEYTHRQVYRTRRMTLSGLDLEKGLPMVQNDDELLDKKERVEKDEQGTDIKTVTETRKRKDGSTYTFEYVLRSFKGAEDDVKNMQPMSKGSSNIPVSSEDEIVNEEVKEEVLEDGTTVKTIIERRRAKDGTEYLRHRIMRIPKMPEPTLQVGSFDDEVLKEEVDEETLDDGTFVKKITERRRSSLSGIQYTLRRKSKVYSQPTYLPDAPEDEVMDESVTEEETDDGAVVTTIIRRHKRNDGTIYTTQNIHKNFKSSRPVKFIFGDDDEVTDHSVNEEETVDGYIIRTILETRRRKDGMEYTVERTEKTTKESPEIHISFTGKKPRRPEDVMTIGEPGDTVVSREETEEEEDGIVIRTIHETRRRVDGTEYTTKTVMKSTPFIIPEHETSYVVIKPENEDEDPGFFPSPDDEIVHTRKKEEKDDEGNPITVIIETRQNKVTGEKYNITKRVHTTDIYVDETGEVVKTHTTTSRPKEPGDESEEDDDVPYGSVSALKSRFIPSKSSPATAPDTSSKPDRVRTLDKKKFFEDAAKNASPKASPIKSSPKKPEKPESKPIYRPEDETKTETTSVHLTTDKVTTNAAFEVKLRLDGSEPEVEDIHTKNISYTPKEDEPDREAPVEEPEEEPKEERPEEDFESPEEEEPKKPTEEEEEPLTRQPEDDDTSQPLKEPENEVHSDVEVIEEPSSDEPDEIIKKPIEKQPLRREIVKEPKKKPTTERIRRKPVEEPKKRREDSPRKKPEERTRRPVDDAPKKRAPVPTQKKSSPTESPTRKAPRPKEPQSSPERSPQRSPQRKSPISSVRASPSASPRRGRSPVRSGVSTPREVTPSRQCCKRQHGPEPTSPTKPLKSQPKTGLPRKPVDDKPKMNGDIRRTTPREPREPKMNGDIHRKPETSRTRRPLDKQPETDRTQRTTTSRPRNDLSRPTRVSETPKRTTTPSSRSPEKKEPTRTSSRPGDNKRKPTTDRAPRSRPGDLDSPKKTTREPVGKPKASEPKLLEPIEPIVTMPQTPMTEDMKHLPRDDDEDGPMIEDVSFDPDLPAYKAHRPSIVREPSEYHEVEPTDDMEDDVIQPEEEPKDKLPEDESDEPGELGEPGKPGKPGKPGEPGEPSEPGEPDEPDEPDDVDSEDEILRKKQPRSEPEKKPKPSEKQPTHEPKEKEPESGRLRDRKTPESTMPITDKKRLFERGTPEPTKTVPKSEPKSFVRKPSDDKLPDKKRPYDRKSSEEEMKPEETKKEPEEFKKPRDRSPSPDSHDEEPRKVVRRPEEEEPVEEEPVGVTRRPADECVPIRVPDDLNKPKHAKLTPEEIVDLESEVIPESTSKTPNEPETKRKTLTSRYAPAEKKTEVPRRKPSYEIKQSVSSKRSMFEQPKEEPVPSPVRRPLFKSKEPEKPKDSKPKEEKPQEPKTRKPLESKGLKEPVKEPPCVKKHVYPLGSDDEDEEPKPTPVPVEEEINLKSSTLVMQATKPTDETDKTPRRPRDKEPEDREPRDKDPRDREPGDSESDDDVPKDTSKTPNLEDKKPTSRERSPFSKETSPFNKESSPKPFTKEGSPGRFLTGKPIDQGINQSKLRRLDRSNSNKKLYEDLEVPKEKLPGYLENIETLTDITVLEIMLEKATSYEERRIIRGQLRSLKRPTRTPATTSTPSSTTTPTYKRFVDMTPTRTTTLTTPTTSTTTTPSSPLPSRRPVPATTTTDKDKGKPTPDAPSTLATTRKPLSKSDADTATHLPAHAAEQDQPQEIPQAPTKPEESKPDEEPLIEPKEKETREPETESVDTRPESDDEEPLVKPKEPSSESEHLKHEESKPATDLWEPTDSSEAFAPVRPRFGRPEPLEPYISGRSRLLREEPAEPSEPYSPRRSRLAREEPVEPSLTHKDSEPTADETSEPKRHIEPTPKPTSDPTSETTPESTSEPDTTRDEPKPKTKPAAEVPKTSSVPQPKVTPEPYSEPLRHQTRHDRAAPQPQKKEQTDVDKIVSAYGVGPTDENGVPLFGLRALRRKTPTSTEPTDEPESSTPSRRPEDEDEPKDKKDEFVPTDSTGRPLFGLRGLRKTTTEPEEEVTEEERHYSRATLEKASISTESSRLVSSVTRQQTTHAEPSRPGKAHQPEDEDIPRRSRPLREIIKMHEKKVSEPTAPTEPKTTTPSRRLRDNFEPDTITTENRVTKTWDLETDLSTRSQDMKNIIAQHESIGAEDEPSPKPSSTTTTTTEKKLTGILKKTSTTSITSNIEEFRSELQDDHRPEIEPLGSTGDILEALTEDQITQLSQEFDRRAQDDGVITSDHIEEEDLTGRKPGTTGYKVSRRTEGEAPDGANFVRKTSYTEITLSTPEASLTGTSTTAHAIESSRLNNYSSSTSAIRSSYSTTRESSSSHQVLDSSSTTTADMREGRSFLDDRSKVTGIGDVISRMGATEAVDHEATVTSDDQARSLLNKFLGAQVLMSGVESMMANSSLSESSRTLEGSGGEGTTTITHQAEGKSSHMISKDGKITDQGSSSYSTGPITITTSSSSPAKALVEPIVVKGVNIVDVQDSDRLNQLLDSCEEYEDRRRIRMRLKSLMAEKKALREELRKHHDLDAEDISSSDSRARGGNITTITTSRTGEGGGYRSSSEVTGQKSSYNFSSSSSSFKSSSAVKGGTITSTKNVSPFQKFKQMDASSSPRSTSTKKEGGGGPLFQFSSSLNRSASGVKDMLLQWCQCRTRDYKGVKIENFSTSWNDGMAFCALIHHFYPDAFDFDKLQPQNRRYNFDLAFRVAEEKAGVMPLLDVEDMVVMKKPDWKCVFTYVQSLYKRLKNE